MHVLRLSIDLLSSFLFNKVNSELLSILISLNEYEICFQKLKIELLV